MSVKRNGNSAKKSSKKSGSHKRGTPKGAKRGRTSAKADGTKADGKGHSAKFTKKTNQKVRQGAQGEAGSNKLSHGGATGGHYIEINSDDLWLYGRHCVAAALRNPQRKIQTLMATKQGTQWLVEEGLREALIANEVLEISISQLDEILPPGCVHQGVVALVKRLPPIALEQIVQTQRGKGPIVVLDQITDPQNIGAIFRSAAAFGANAIIVQDRRTPALAGALAKAAAGAIEIIPCVEVVNIARTLSELKNFGYYCLGLAGQGDQELQNFCANNSYDKIALVLGAEGGGLRPLVSKSCDELISISINDSVQSLNVSTASAIALYALQNSL